MLGEYSHTKSESLAQIRTIMAKIQHFLLGGCFFIGAPCTWRYHIPFLNARVTSEGGRF